MSAPLRFEPAGDGRPWCTEWDTSAMTSPEVSGEEGAVSLWRFFELASEQLVLPPGEVRLLGWTDQEPPGMSIQPTASQTVAATFVLVHLQRSRLPAPQRDKNCRAHEAPNDEGKWKTSTLDD